VSEPGIVWTPRHLLLGACFALPALVIAAFDAGLGISFALGALPATSLGLPARRRGRIVYLIIGVLVGCGLLLGASLARTPALALVVLMAACVGAALGAGRGKAGTIVLTLGVPMIGIGFSFDDAAAGLGIAAIMVAGSAWCLLVSLAWPETEPRPAAPPRPPSRMLGYGIRLALAAGIAATIGFTLGLDHIGWAVGATLLVMRPVAELVVTRALGRAASVIVAATLTGGFMLLAPPGWLMGLVALALLAALAALVGSRWYVTGFFGTSLAFMLLLQGDPADVPHRFWERSIETLVGVCLALLFGVLVPWVQERIRTAGAAARAARSPRAPRA
jgi:hypothetical protein